MYKMYFFYLPVEIRMFNCEFKGYKFNINKSDVQGYESTRFLS